MDFVGNNTRQLFLVIKTNEVYKDIRLTVFFKSIKHLKTVKVDFSFQNKNVKGFLVYKIIQNSDAKTKDKNN